MEMKIIQIKDRMIHNIKEIVNIVKIRAISIIVAFNIFSIVGCDDNKFYYAEYIDLESECWQRKNLLQYNINSIDSVTEQKEYDVVLSLRHSDDYQYEDLWIEVRTCQKDSIEYVDTIKLELLSPDKRWSGKGYGGVYEINETLYREKKMDSIISFKVRHIMVDSILKGINNIGILIIDKND